jgi:hypothetical protein
MSAMSRRMAVLLVCCLMATASPAPARPQSEPVQLVLSGLPARDTPGYAALSRLAHAAPRQVLSLTRAEVWAVAPSKVQALTSAAAAHGASVTRLDPHWRDLLRPAPAHTAMSPEQLALLKQVAASKATMGVSVMVMPDAPVVEFALTRGVGARAGGRRAQIRIRLDATSELTLRRSSVRTDDDTCVVWRGRVQGTGAHVTLLWWPMGKLAGTIRHRGRIYSIRHVGGRVHAVVAMQADRMPPQHPPTPPHRRADHPAPADHVENKRLASRPAEAAATRCWLLSRAASISICPAQR